MPAPDRMFSLSNMPQETEVHHGKTFVTNIIFLFLVIKSYFLSQFIADVLSQYWLCTTRFMALQCTMQDYT